MLGPETSNYQRNNIVFAVAILCLLAMVAFGALLWQDPRTRDGIYYCGTLAALFGFWAYWISSCKITLHTDGFASETMFGRKELSFEDLESFAYHAVKQSVNFIPVGTYYTLKFVFSNGQKLKFGNRFGHMEALSGDLIRLTTTVLLPKLSRRFDAGETLDFGTIKVSRSEGISIKKLFKWKTIPWNNLSSFKLEKGVLYVFEVGQKFDTGTSIAFIPNAFVLAAMLDVLQRPASNAATAR